MQAIIQCEYGLNQIVLHSLGITVPEIVDAIQQQSVIVPGGKFGAEPAPPGTDFTYTVRLPERLKSPEEFGEVVVRTREGGLTG